MKRNDSSSMRSNLFHRCTVVKQILILEANFQNLYSDNETITTTPPRVNGGWGPCEPWGECSVSWGGGMKMKTRRCDSSKSSNGRKNCRGKLIKTRRCKRKSCSRNVLSKKQCRKAKKQGKCTMDTSVLYNCKKACKICN